MTVTMTHEDHVRAALKRLNPKYHEQDISWPSLDAILADRDRYKAAAEATGVLNAVDRLRVAHEQLCHLRTPDGLTRESYLSVVCAQVAVDIEQALSALGVTQRA